MNTRKSKTATAKPTAEAKGYKDHAEGSRKGKVHELFDKQGAEAAWTLGLKLGLKQGTLRTWFAQWKHAKIEKKLRKAKLPTKTTAPSAPA